MKHAITKKARREETVATEMRDALAVETGGLSTRLADGLWGARYERKLTQEDLAERAQLDPRQYRKLESGAANATLTTLQKLARALHLVDPLELFAPLKEGASERRGLSAAVATRRKLATATFGLSTRLA